MLRGGRRLPQHIHQAPFRVREEARSSSHQTPRLVCRRLPVRTLDCALPRPDPENSLPRHFARVAKPNAPFLPLRRRPPLPVRGVLGVGFVQAQGKHQGVLTGRIPAECDPPLGRHPPSPQLVLDLSAGFDLHGEARHKLLLFQFRRPARPFLLRSLVLASAGGIRILRRHGISRGWRGAAGMKREAALVTRREQLHPRAQRCLAFRQRDDLVDDAPRRAAGREHFAREHLHEASPLPP
mmetsp:Transcript_46421/g.105834  ORF Transcript_46421/g.105834 Transcript_46421/m.105834 type:complete len:239 (+) Transcript_46421:153-869(+)